MQDVIFEGAETRKAAQLCEVSLLSSPTAKSSSAANSTRSRSLRRGHRDGQGEYFFNGQSCRLKDIHKLFMDTGIGRTSYSVMAQGQIDLILSSKPDDRRAVFEEAAGITRYKSQRREAMGKLALTEQNLARVTDIVGEVSRQIGGLKRQAAKAIRFKRLSHRLRHLSLAWSSRHYTQLTAALAELDGKVAALRAAATARKASLEERQADLDAAKSRRSILNNRVQDAQQATFDLRSQSGAVAEKRRPPGPDAGAAPASRTGWPPPATTFPDESEMQIREVTATQVDTGEHDKQPQLESSRAVRMPSSKSATASSRSSTAG